jgi:Family of unknown function (DUF5995)
MTHDSIDGLLADMDAELAVLTADGDARRFFHATYSRTTRAVADEITAGGFADNHWVRRWDLAFADLYMAALAADRAGEPISGPWRVAFDAALREPDLPPVRHVLFGMNAHINYDLPQALLRVIDESEFDDEDLLRRRLADHRHLDTVLQSRIGAEDAELTAVSTVTRFDRLIAPANRAATGRFLTESRAKVWRNARALDRARRAGDTAYAVTLAELEGLCAARVRDLTAPGQVLLRLARRGFGVLLPGA